MGLFVGRLNSGRYEPSWLFKLLRPRISGNTINGLGESRCRRPTPPYHRVDFHHPWSLVQWSFYLFQALFRREQTRLINRSRALSKRGFVPVASRQKSDSAESWTDKVKEVALQPPAVSAVGIAALDREWVFDRDEIEEPWVIVLAGFMDFDNLSKNLEGDYDAGNTEVLRAYLRTHEVAVDVANWIRRQGWHAFGHGGPNGAPLNLIPAAIAAGIGQLGKHGSLMNEELGPCFRMSYVLTDLPLVADTPRDIGVDDFCTSCRLCTRHCPPQAIFEQKQMVRGVEKWYVDFDRCVPFFNDFDGCAVCISVCPWARPGLAPGIVKKMLARRARKPADAIASLNPVV